MYEARLRCWVWRLNSATVTGLPLEWSPPCLSRSSMSKLESSFKCEDIVERPESLDCIVEWALDPFEGLLLRLLTCSQIWKCVSSFKTEFPRFHYGNFYTDSLNLESSWRMQDFFIPSYYLSKIDVRDLLRRRGSWDGISPLWSTSRSRKSRDHGSDWLSRRFIAFWSIHYRLRIIRFQIWSVDDVQRRRSSILIGAQSRIGIDDIPGNGRALKRKIMSFNM